MNLLDGKKSKLENIEFSSFDDIECKSKKLLDKIYPNNLIPLFTIHIKENILLIKKMKLE